MNMKKSNEQELVTPESVKQESLKWYVLNKVVDVVTSEKENGSKNKESVQEFIEHIPKYTYEHLKILDNSKETEFHQHAMDFFNENNNNKLPEWVLDSMKKYFTTRKLYIQKVEKQDLKLKLEAAQDRFVEEKALFDVYASKREDNEAFIIECEELGCRVRRSEYAKIPNGRIDYEDKVVAMISDIPKKYASLASGFLNQDLCILKKLSKEKSILPDEVHAIDPKYTAVINFFQNKNFKYIPNNSQKFLNEFIIERFNQSKPLASFEKIDELINDVLTFKAVTQFSNILKKLSKNINKETPSKLYLHKITNCVIKKDLKFDVIVAYDIYDKNTVYSETEVPLGYEFKKLRRRTLSEKGKWCVGMKYEGENYKFLNNPKVVITHNEDRKQKDTLLEIK